MKQLLTTSLLLISICCFSQWSKVSSSYPISMSSDTTGISCVNLPTGNPVTYTKYIYFLNGSWANNANWQTLNPSFQNITPSYQYVEKVHLVTDSLIYFEINDGDTIYKTSDKGQSYSSITIPANNVLNLNNKHLDILSDSQLIMTDGRRILSITNDITIDTLLELSTGRIIYDLKLHNISKNTFYLSTWSFDSISLFSFPPYMDRLDILEFNKQNSSTFNTFYSDTQGYSYGNLFDEVSFIDSLTGFSKKRDTVFKTTDGGRNWNYISKANINNSSNFSMEFLNDSLGFIAGDSGKINSTYDGGYNWFAEHVNENNTLPSEIEIIDKQRVGIRAAGSNPLNGFYYIRDFTTSTKEIKKEKNDLSLYPNPATDYIHIKRELPINTNFTIMSVSGKVVFSNSLSNNPIYVGHLLSGIYLFRLETPDQTLYSKFIKE